MAVYQTLTLKEAKVDTLANASSVQILWKSQQTGESHNLNTRTANYWVTINGTRTQYSVSYTLPAKTTQTILNRTITVPHKDDGTGSIKVETWMDTRISAGEVEMSKTLTLTPIARGSTIGATDAFVGSTSIIAVNRKSEEYTHSIELSFGGLTRYIDGDGNIVAAETKHTATNIPFPVPTLFYQYMTDRKSQTCQLTCRTYQGDTQIGSDQSATFTVTANEDLCRPTVQGSVRDVNPATLALTGNSNTLVRYMSTARCEITAGAKNYASITKRTIEGVQTAGTVDFPNVQTDSFTFQAEDTRGYTNEVTVEKSLIPYVPLTINTKITRTDPTSGNATLEVNGKCFVGNFGAVRNTITVRYRIGSANPVAISVQTDTNKQVYAATANVPGLDYSRSHSVVVEVIDALGSASQTLQVKPGIPVFDWGENDFSFNVPVAIGGALDMKGFAIKNVKDPQDASDAVTKAYVDQKAHVEQKDLVVQLWENASIASQFPAQTISLGLSEYTGVFIRFLGVRTGTGYFVSGFIPVGKNAMMQIHTTGGILRWRSIDVTATGVVFGNGDENGSTNASYLIPTEIYGVKEALA